jgi:hypothetical protein
VSRIDSDVEVVWPPTSFPTFGGGQSSRRGYSIATELFPIERFGVRVGYSRPDNDFQIDSYDVGATWFFKPRVAVQLVLARTSYGSGPSESHTNDAGVRFLGRL